MPPPCPSSASNRLPQQQPGGKTSRSPHGSGVKVSQLHLPNLPARHGIKHLSSSVTRPSQGHVPRQAPASGRGGGTGRREAVTVPRDVTKTSVGAAHAPANSNVTQQGARKYARTSTAASGEVGVLRVTISKVNLPFLHRAIRAVMIHKGVSV